MEEKTEIQKTFSEIVLKLAKMVNEHKDIELDLINSLEQIMYRVLEESYDLYSQKHPEFIDKMINCMENKIIDNRKNNK